MFGLSPPGRAGAEGPLASLPPPRDRSPHGGVPFAVVLAACLELGRRGGPEGARGQAGAGVPPAMRAGEAAAAGQAEQTGEGLRWRWTDWAGWLASLGLDADSIARCLGRPRGEVELAAALWRLGRRAGPGGVR
ncbi:MAG TPA: hypothetical protein VIL11_02305 [Limnochordales bacterium]